MKIINLFSIKVKIRFKKDSKYAYTIRHYLTDFKFECVSIIKDLKRKYGGLCYVSWRQIILHRKQKRQAKHIVESEVDRGHSQEEAERIAWSTVNKQDGGGKKKSH